MKPLILLGCKGIGFGLRETIVDSLIVAESDQISRGRIRRL